MNEHLMHAVIMLLAANACANLSAVDNPIAQNIFLGCGVGFLIGGIVHFLVA